MQNVQTLKLSRATLMFPLALVLFEFSVYIGNDLVQPAMLAITQDFGVSSAWAPSSMSFYLLELTKVVKHCLNNRRGT